MYKATRDFIALRSKHCESPLRLPPRIEQLGTGEPNKCFENSRAFVATMKAQGKNFMSLSGWMILPYDKANDSAEIIQHWWVGDETGRQFDVTPNPIPSVEYVIDFDLNNFALKNYDRIKSCVAMSMRYKNGTFHILKDPEKSEFEKIEELKTDLLFRYL